MSFIALATITVDRRAPCDGIDLKGVTMRPDMRDPDLRLTLLESQLEALVCEMHRLFNLELLPSDAALDQANERSRHRFQAALRAFVAVG